VDETTGIQARERVAETLPMRPGQVEKVEFEYTRHGTQCLIGNFEVATGRAIAPTVQATRGEKDFAAHTERTVATDPEATWIFVADNLTTHVSEWLNQVEIWFSVLARRVLRRGNLRSVADLREKILAYIAYYNRTGAKPYRWAYTGRPLNV
jgi:hypothetical protein